MWYDILFYKREWLKYSPEGIKPPVLQLFRYPIPEEIRCFLWSEFLGVQESYEVGYYSIIRSKQFSIPSSSLSVIEADLRRMDITTPEYRQMLRLLVIPLPSLNAQTSIYLHDSKIGYVQGMHFLMYALLHLFTEEEAFFVFLRVGFSSSPHPRSSTSYHATTTTSTSRASTPTCSSSRRCSTARTPSSTPPWSRRRAT